MVLVLVVQWRRRSRHKVLQRSVAATMPYVHSVAGAAAIPLVHL